ncbi:putative Molybdenum ABC transporter, solute-binding protein [Nitrospira sp. KM1]|uniref:molybdate ABC transporter substrate-binding protein n=1 Tax=Nitrospira sp. KM1 TaxID=1936990 RepID=UPI0013A7730F|nr:molybdate ABC transporter substrate-binding protein [Nitrospira sp. KM1]BCA53894.1 putative Molybdenum ABC transporter, solute-binding protein [Nitrospira sp. KM1]
MKSICNFWRMLIPLGCMLGILATSDPIQAESLTVGATHTLKAAFEEIIPLFEREYGATVDVVYAPSKTLRRQIEKRAPIDVFLPGSVDEVMKLQKKGLVLGDYRVYAQTSLVLVMPTNSPATPISFREGPPNRVTRIAVGDPQTSGLGDITAKALTQVDPAYMSRSHFVQAPHSHDIVDLVRSGAADVGLLYRVDAINSAQMRIIDEIPAGSHTSVQFGQAILSTCRSESLRVAERFLDYMMSARVQKLLLKYGFDAAHITTSPMAQLIRE